MCHHGSFTRVGWFFVLISVLSATSLFADVGPPVNIKMPSDTPAAVSGQEYRGVFEIHVGRSGVLDDFRLDGEGWTVHSFEAPEFGFSADAGVMQVSFTATPRDADAPIRLSLTHDGRKVSRVYRIGPAAFAVHGKDRPAVAIADADFVPNKRQNERPSDGPTAQGGAITLRFTGRIVYLRPSGFDKDGDPILVDGTNEGVDAIWVQVMDEDFAFDEVIWEGFTASDGTFDSGNIQWDDCDVVGCDDPDIYFRFEADTPIVNVQDPSDITEPDYSWSNAADVIDDFTGSMVNFGTHTPGSLSDMPALFIHNSIVRAHRFVQQESGLGLNVPEVDVLWPEDSSNAFYDGEINIPVSREWREDTHTHEYGHHLLESFAENVTPDYCQGLNFCDGATPCTAGTDCEDPGHCRWCPETDHDAWNEGFPNWLADAVTRDYPNRYQFSDGSPYAALRARSQENIGLCCQDDGVYPPFITEGYIGALLRDIEDGKDVDGNSLQDDHDGDGISDCLSLGYDEIFTVATVDDVITPAEFIAAFNARYPQHMPSFYSTAFNVHPDFVNPFPADTSPPGAVPFATSRSHPTGVGGTSPCIEVELGPVPDDVTGACAFSVEWSTTSNGIEPDMTEEVDASCFIVSPARSLGDQYVSLRAKDCAGRWSSQWATFGPFTVNECNGNGILDVCEVACDASGYGDAGILACRPAASFCSTLYPGNCGTAADCQPNAVPDTCDIVDGESEDCDLNGTPDECQSMKHFKSEAAPPEGFDWALPSNWEEGEIPQDGDTVCIPDDAGVVTVVYEEEDTHLNSIASYQNFIMAGAVFPSQFPRPDLELDENSFVLGEFQMEGPSTLTVNDRLYVDEKFHWMGGRIDGNGVVQVGDGVRLTRSSVTLVGAMLRVTGGESFSNGPRITLSNGADVIIRPSGTYTYEGSSVIFDGGGGLIDLEGSLISIATDPSVTMGTPIDNSGLIHAQAGELFMSNGGTHTGDVLGDLGTRLKFGGPHQFVDSSTLTADTVELGASNTESMIRGTVNISERIDGTGGTWTFADDANIIDYGNHVFVERGRVNFNAPVDQPIDLETVTITSPGESAGRIDFNTGQPVNVVDFNMITGSLYGPSPINISGVFSWTNGSIQPGDAITANGPVMINATSSSRTIRRVLNINDQATIRSQFGIASGVPLNISNGVVVDIQFNSGSISGGVITNNGGTIQRTSGNSIVGFSGAVINDGLFHNQTGTLSIAPHPLHGSGTHTGDVISDPGTTLILGGIQTFTPTSSITAESLELTASNSESIIHGTFNVSERIDVTGGTWTLAPDANIVDYGDHFYVERGRFNVNAPTDVPINLQSLTITSPGESSGTADFDTGQSVNVVDFNMMTGRLEGPSPINVSGVFSWTNGNILAGGAITSDGTSNINPTSSARTLSRPFINNGDMIFRGGFSLGGSATIDNTETGFVDFQYDFRTISSRTLNNEGTIIRSSNDDTTLLQNTDVNNSGSIEVQQGTLQITTALVTQTDGEIIINADTTLDMSTSDPLALQGGVLKGTGNYLGDIDNSGGVVAPGLSIGELPVDGDYDQPGGTLEIEIDNTGTDKLAVTGTATLGGELVVTHLNGFEPDMTDEFIILEAANVTGEFDDLSIPPVYEVNYNPTNVTLTIAAVSPDLNGDGVVNLLDFQLFQECFNGSGNMASANCDPMVNADLDQDGDVDLFDYERLVTATSP